MLDHAYRSNDILQRYHVSRTPQNKMLVQVSHPKLLSVHFCTHMLNVYIRQWCVGHGLSTHQVMLQLRDVPFQGCHLTS